MFNAIRIITSLVSLAIVPVRADHPTVDRVVMTGFTSAELRASDEALSLFADAGLPLPLLEIHRHRDVAPCNGFQGFHREFGERSVIDICTAETGDFEQRTLRWCIDAATGTIQCCTLNSL